MKSLILILSTAALSSAGSLFFAPSLDCTGDGSVQYPAEVGAECSQIAGMTSASATAVDDGCSCK